MPTGFFLCVLSLLTIWRSWGWRTRPAFRIGSASLPDKECVSVGAWMQRISNKAVNWWGF